MVKTRTGGYPRMQYFDLFLLIDNEQGHVTEWTAEVKRRWSLAPSDWMQTRQSRPPGPVAVIPASIERQHLRRAAG